MLFGLSRWPAGNDQTTPVVPSTATIPATRCKEGSKTAIESDVMVAGSIAGANVAFTVVVSDTLLAPLVGKTDVSEGGCMISSRSPSTTIVPDAGAVVCE